MGYDVNDVRTWHQKISEFSEFAKRQDAEFDLKRFPNGKELLTVGLYYRPRKEFKMRVAIDNPEKLTDKLVVIQSKLIAPKGQFNSFGKYSYRSCEDILEALKPLLSEYGVCLILHDEIVQLGERFYVKATAKISDGTEMLSVQAYARESEAKKGMDESQITGAASSYARKYALNGLFCIDDTKDADSTNKHNGNGSKITDKQEHELRDLLISCGLEKKEDKLLSYLGVEKMADLKADDFDKAVFAIKSRGGAK